MGFQTDGHGFVTETEYAAANERGGPHEDKKLTFRLFSGSLYPAIYRFATRLTDDPRDAVALTREAFNGTRKQLQRMRSRAARSARASHFGSIDGSLNRLGCVLREAGSYTVIQRLIQTEDAICREPFGGAIATALTKFSRQIGRLDQHI